MSVTFSAVYRTGARISIITGSGSTSYIIDKFSRVGWGYSSGYGSSLYISHDAAATFEGALPDAVEPVSADASQISLTVALENALSMAVSVGVLTAQLSDSASGLFSQLRNSSNVVGTISAGSTSGTFTLTRAQAANVLAYGIKAFPTTEFGTTDSAEPLSIDGTRVVYAANNPAARGRVTDVSPGEYSTLVGGAANVISYTYRNDNGGYAQAYLSVIAKNQDTGEVVTILRKSSKTVADGGRGSFTIPADTLTAGRWTLTICAAPSGSASYYADGSDFWVTGQTFSYTVRENPSTSTVTADGRPIPAVSWTSTGQSAYQVRFGDFDSGARAGASTSFVVPQLFADGAYPVQVRTATNAGEWSDWTDTVWESVENVPPSGATVSLTGAVSNGCVELAFSLDGTEDAVSFLVYRDGVLIAQTNECAYVDRFGEGEYIVRAVMTATRYYAQSSPVTVRLNLPSDLLSTDGGYTWIPLKYTPEAKSQPESISTPVTFAYYAGREKPIAVSSGKRARTKSFAYLFTSRVQARLIRELEGHDIAIKTTRGEHIYGVMTELNWGDARLNAVSFTVRETYRDGEEAEIELSV